MLKMRETYSTFSSANRKPGGYNRGEEYTWNYWRSEHHTKTWKSGGGDVI
jgi:hypothetical protein